MLEQVYQVGMISILLFSHQPFNSDMGEKKENDVSQAEGVEISSGDVHSTQYPINNPRAVQCPINNRRTFPCLGPLGRHGQAVLVHGK